MLLEARADTAARNLIGATALHAAATASSTFHTSEAPIAIMKLLLQHKADVACETNARSVALHAAVGNERAVRLLVAHGSNINAANKVGVTALHMAALQGRPDVVRTLLLLAADPTAETVRAKTPYLYALSLSPSSGLTASTSLSTLTCSSTSTSTSTSPYCSAEVRAEVLNMLEPENVAHLLATNRWRFSMYGLLPEAFQQTVYTLVLLQRCHDDACQLNRLPRELLWLLLEHLDWMSWVDDELQDNDGDGSSSSSHDQPKRQRRMYRHACYIS
jgi:ankyrin repeat protein